MKKQIFMVSCMGCNAQTFKDNYSEYIIAEYPDYMDNVTFSMNAPSAIKKEVADLQEEGIYILPTPTPDKIRYCAYLKNGALIGEYKRLRDARDCCQGIDAKIKKVVVNRGRILKIY